jgi:integrase
LHDGYISLIGEAVKTHRRRNIPLTDPAKEILENLAKEAKQLDTHGNLVGLVFPSTSNPDKPRDMHKAFDKVVKEVGLDNLPGAGKLRIHDLRHCCGSALIMSGVDLETTRKLLGHRDITTTQRYLHVVDSHMRDAISKIGNLGISKKKNLK